MLRSTRALWVIRGTLGRIPPHTHQNTQIATCEFVVYARVGEVPSGNFRRPQGSHWPPGPSPATNPGSRAPTRAYPTPGRDQLKTASHTPIDPQQPLAAAPDGRPRRHGGHSSRGGRRAIAAPEGRPSGVASPRAARGFPAAETGPPLPPNHPHATAPTKAPSARYRRAQSPTMTIYEPVPARVPLHLGVSRADSSR